MKTPVPLSWKTLLVAFVALLLLHDQPADAQVGAGVFHTKGVPLSSLDVIGNNQLTHDQQITVSTLAGLAAKSSGEQIFIDEGGPTANWKNNLQNAYGIPVNNYSSFTDLLSRFQNMGKIGGYVLYDRASNPRSVTAATSLCGPLNAIAVDVSLEATVRSLGILTLKADVRTRDELWVYSNYPNSFDRKLASELNPTIPYHCRDYCVMGNAFVFFDGMTSWRSSVLGALNNEAFLFGYGVDEGAMIQDASNQGVVSLPSDTAPNLAALSSIYYTGNLTQNTWVNPPSENNVHYVCFVMSDGDNIAFNNWSLLNLFNDPNRGAFNMGWAVSVSMVDLCPSNLRWYYQNSANGTFKDHFVAGPSGNGYYYPCRVSAGELDNYLKRLNSFMGVADLRIMQVLEQGGNFSRSDVWSKFLAQPNIDGILYSDGTTSGQISFASGKPVIAERDFFSDTTSDSTLISRINSRPATPNSAGGYSYVLVHAWTKNLGNIRNVINGLNSNVRVVTPDAFVKLVARNLGPRIPPGTYKITARHSGKALEVAGGSNADGANVQQGTYQNKNYQQWIVTHIGGDQYKIIGVRSGRAAEVFGASTSDGANVDSWTFGDGLNQKWTFTPTDSGFYKVTAVHSGKALEVAGGGTQDGANVQQGTYTGANHQQWALTPVPFIADGTYRVLARHSSKALTASGTANDSPVRQSTDTGASSQRWTITHLGNDRYAIVGVGSGRALNINGGSIADGRIADIADYSGANQQQWLITPSDSGYYKITARHSGKVLDVAGASTADGATILQWNYGGAANQQWDLQPISANGPLADGTYKIIARHSGKAVDATGTANGANVLQWTYHSANWQQWNVTHLGNGQYKIIGVQSGKALEVAGASTANGGNVQIWDFGNAANQKWILTPTDSGYYRVTAVHSGKDLDVNAGSTADGANIQQWTWGGAANQQWTFQAP